MVKLKQKINRLAASVLALPVAGLVSANIAPPHSLPLYPEHAVQYVVEELPLPKLDENRLAGSYWFDEEVLPGDNINKVLARLGVSQQHISSFVKASPVDPQMLSLHAGQRISVRVDAAQDITDLQFFSDGDNGEYHLVALEKVNGKWQIRAGEVDTETMPSLRSVTVTSSASGALARAGVPVEVRIALKEIFADKLNVDGLQPGDTVRLLYESLYFHGREVATGNILAAEIHSKGKTHYAYYFEDDENGGNFYDEKGVSLKKGFVGEPIAGSYRISSPYGIRHHPVLHTVKMHTGIDYAAPAGTKILAPSDGTVVFQGWQGGYGNTVVLRHANGIETLYAHMNGFVPGMQVGKTVRAGDVIGFVGNTGRSTGPHLHYEVRVNGQHVNPATVALPARKMKVSDMAALKTIQQQANAKFATIRGLPVMVAQGD